MSRITAESKCRLCRAEGMKLFLKGTRCNSSKCPIERKGAVPPGMHGIKRTKKPTDYGLQLRAKQKAKRIYGLNEAQFSNLFRQAKKLKGLVGLNFLSLLERRLDSLVYSSGLSSSRSSAKQLIGHGNIFINGKPLNTPSYLAKAGDVISVNPKILDNVKDIFRINDKDPSTPAWLDVDRSHYSAKVTSAPRLTEASNDIDINLIVEYYSR
ncbi:MAG: 30S ribosomal protein S4 [Candidatus Shapirobacteria bacterium]|jgi:small subunit ribosomal protein S4